MGAGGRRRQAARSGVPSEELAQVVSDLVGPTTVVQLSDAVYWGREIEHERYLLSAVLPDRS